MSDFRCLFTSHSNNIYISGFLQRDLKLISFIYKQTTRVKGLTQGPSRGNLVELRFKLTTFHSIIPCLNH